MNELNQWRESNERYLSAALKWLRLRLTRLTESAPAEKQITGSKEGRHSCWLGRRWKDVSKTAPLGKKINDVDISRAAMEMDEAAGEDVPPALVILGQRLGLSRFEQDVLLLCAAMEFDTRIPALCARAQGHPERPYPTFALSLILFDTPAWDALSAERPLRLWRLIEITRTGATPLTMSALRADERIVNYIKGLNQLDDRLAPFIAPFDEAGNGEHRLASSHESIARTIEHRLRHWSVESGFPVVQLTGTDPVSKQQVARRILSRLGFQRFRLPGELLPSAADELDTLARLWQRESILIPLALYVDAADMVESDRHTDGQLNRFLTRCGTLSFLDTREPRSGLGLNAMAFEVDKPLPAEQKTLWKEALGEDAGDKPGQLAAQFNLNQPTIRQIAEDAMVEDQDNGSVPGIQDRLWNACLGRTRPRLDRLAQRIEPKVSWSDIVLPETPLALLCEISDQVSSRTMVYDDWGFRRIMNRGFGISALFAGESGTGKTMGAEVIASQLRMNLYRIDLSAVVSKYIGETEKNLRRVFDAAEDGGVILFFDEADALFGKRSEVKDSHDRYANIEINYLLQRMEAFRGLAILATNMKSALDRAFMRRLRFIVNFPFPGHAERKLIWERVFPRADEEKELPGVPVGRLDYDQLARLSLTGGSIHNVALNAAFHAARVGTNVTMELIIEAARTEFRKLEMPMNERDFRLQPVYTEK